MKKVEKQPSYKKQLIKRLIVLVSILFCFLLINLLSKNQKLSEFMTRNVSRYILEIMGNLSSLLKFSFFEFFIIFALILLLYISISFFIGIKNSGKRSFLKLINFVSVVLCLVIFYELCVGFSYYREPLILPATTKAIDDNSFEEAIIYFTEDFINIANSLNRDKNGCVISPYSQKELNKILKSEFDRLQTDYLNPYTPTFKKTKFSFVMAELGISGIFFGPLGEPNITGFALDYEIPSLAAHEIAHAKGVMRETDAELLSAYLMLSSNDPYLRYSGYMYNYQFYLLNPLHYINKDLYNELYDMIPKAVFDEQSYAYRIREKYHHLSDFGKRMNDIYLFINGQKKGTDSYIDLGEVEKLEPNPNNPNEPPKYVYHYSQTEKTLLSIYLLKN